MALQKYWYISAEPYSLVCKKIFKSIKHVKSLPLFEDYFVRSGSSLCCYQLLQISYCIVLTGYQLRKTFQLSLSRCHSIEKFWTNCKYSWKLKRGVTGKRSLISFILAGRMNLIQSQNHSKKYTHLTRLTTHHSQWLSLVFQPWAYHNKPKYS